MRILIDACVLYPTVLREIVLAVAARGRFAALWSPRILEEWARAAARGGAGDEAIARGEIALLRARLPDCEITPPDGAETALYLPDAADRHVLAAAIAARADAILTANLRDFPRRALAVHGLRAVSPDALLMEIWLDEAAPVEAAIREVRARTEEISGRDQPLRPLLKRAGLPRLGKALRDRDS